MGESAKNTENAPKKSFFKGLKSEFKKIIWPDKESLAKQSVAVVLATVVLGVIIAVVDMIFKFGIDKILKIG